VVQPVERLVQACKSLRSAQWTFAREHGGSELDSAMSGAVVSPVWREWSLRGRGKTLTKPLCTPQAHYLGMSRQARTEGRMTPIL